MTGERRTFADNRNGNTVAEAIRAFAEYGNHRQPISIVTGYFDLGGFAAIEDVLTQAPSVRILLGAEPVPPSVRRLLLPGEPSPSVESRLADIHGELIADRDTLPFTRSAHSLLHRFLEWISRPTVEVRRYTREFLHGKAFVFGHEAGVIAGSANFTGKGLTQNLELVLGQYNPDEVQRVYNWFEDLWAEAEPYDLAEVYAQREIEIDPYTIYLRMLLELYGDEILKPDESATRAHVPGSTLRLAEFQRLGVKRALRILEKWNGVLLADGVGLGKSYMAGDIIRHYVREKGQRALVIAPAAIRDHMWQSFLLQNNLAVEVVSYQQLASDRQVGEPPAEGQPDRRPHHLKFDVNDYRLIVVDEAHAFRNPDTLHYRALRRLMTAGGIQRKLVLLTATPVNNSVWDLYYQIMLFARHDGAFAGLGIPNLREFFKQVLTLDLEQAAPRKLFPLLDAISVRRTRHHVKRYYPGETLDTPDGPKEIRFPTPHLVPVSYSFESVLSGFFTEVAVAIEEELSMARYRTEAYRLQPEPGDLQSQEVLAGIMRSQLLKRFESSIYAFQQTLNKLIASHDYCLELINRGVVPRPGTDPEELLDTLGTLEENGEWSSVSEDYLPISEYNIEALRADLLRDKECLSRLADRAASVTPEEDPKLQALWGLLEELSRRPVGDQRKVVFFSYYADTVEYVAKQLARRSSNDVAWYKTRFVAVSGTRAFTHRGDTISTEDAVAGFAPVSSKAAPGTPDQFDLLLATDVLAEGQNLQQASTVINFDLPWNPMRLAQRNGRIDRIGSPHSDVYLYCFLPSNELDEYLNLEERLRHKIAQANASVGVESPLLPGMEAVPRNFDEVRRQIKAVAAGDATVLDELDETIDAFSGESFRDELRRALMTREMDELRSLPWGIGSGFRGTRQPGVVFVARIGKQPHWRFVPLQEGSPLESTLLTILERARCPEDQERFIPEDVKQQLFDLWEIARNDIYQQYEAALDPARVTTSVPRAQRDAMAILQRADVEGVERAMAALQYPWPANVVRRLRSLLRENAGITSQKELARKLIRFIDEEGMQAPPPMELLPPIDIEDIKLICYQVVVP